MAYCATCDAEFFSNQEVVCWKWRLRYFKTKKYFNKEHSKL